MGQPRKRNRPKVCEDCGGAFLASRSDARFCSERCRNRAKGDRAYRRWRAAQSDEALAALNAARRQAWHSNRQAKIQGFWEAQQGLCYLCGDPLRADDVREVHLDHDHRCCGPSKSGGVSGCAVCQRGLACKACNLLIGYGRDDPERIRRVAASLEAARSMVEQRAAEEVAGQAYLFPPTLAG